MDSGQDGAGGGDAGARAEFEGRLLAGCGLNGRVRGAHEGVGAGGVTMPTPCPVLTRGQVEHAGALEPDGPGAVTADDSYRQRRCTRKVCRVGGGAEHHASMCAGAHRILCVEPKAIT